MKNPIRLLPWALLAASASPQAREPIAPVDRAYVSLGVYRSANGLSGRWDAADGTVGTRFDFQGDLGFDERERALYWNAGGSFGEGRRHKLEVFGYDYDDTSARRIDRSLRIRDDAYPVDASLAGALDIGVIGASYTWFFRRGERHALGLGLGAVNYDLTVSLAADYEVNGQPRSSFQRFREQAWAPMLHGEYVRSLSPNWRWGLAASYVKKPGGEIAGEAIDAQARLEWFPWGHAGFSLRYNYNDVRLDFRRSRYDGDVDLETRGLQLAMMLRF
ncbi:hypothetical protein [Arenimonas fontis]|uniref:Outer membrane protein beta-barrel domain-containing protein n=1 Tax=Arenimonas fontis TaxID=2608255 RepID=A0A5B2ZD60_9GAMM|nr:hypothetical protein [Arenimonas fontis]KAA2285011.1 hypothetical protein F0415_07145 [Arenimonas fontis]